MKKYIVLIIMIVLLLILVTINIITSTKTTTCSYTIEDNFYKEKIIIEINRYKPMTIRKEYEFKDEDILNLEKDELTNDDYEIEVSSKKLTATKKEKGKDYYKTIKKYKQLGFSCH